MNNTQNQETLLIVDDMPINITVLAEFLKIAGFNVLIAKNGKRAIQKAEKDHPDLILMDIMMPEMSGFDACRILKSQENTKEIPIIFMTALTDTVDKLEGFKLGAADYITKPIQREELLARVKSHLKTRKLQRQLQVQNQQLQQQADELAKRNDIMTKENEKSDKLLLNILKRRS